MTDLFSSCNGRTLCIGTYSRDSDRKREAAERSTPLSVVRTVVSSVLQRYLLLL